MASSENYEIPGSGAVFTFGRSGFAENKHSHFFIRNDPIVEVSCGDEHTAVICKSGRIFLFGRNEYGQLGLGHTRTVTKPSCLKYLKPFHSTHVACGKSHTIVSTDCGRLFSFGSNSDGQLGTGDVSDKMTPQLVNTKYFPEQRISALSAGCFHSACLTEIGELYVWGSNSDGQCGSGTDTHILIPTKIELKHMISTFSCGYYHTAFISEGVLYSFGEEDSGKLGYKKVKSSNAPEKVETNFKSVKVVCGGNHTLVLSGGNSVLKSHIKFDNCDIPPEGGQVFSCGSNFSGQLGLGVTTAESYCLSPVNFPLNDTAIIQIAAGESHSAFITESGKLYTCGDGRYGKTCHENELTNFTLPTLVNLFEQFHCNFVSCGGCQTMVLAKYKDVPFDSENAKITSLPPLKLNKSLSENETTENEERKIPNIVDEEKGNLRIPKDLILMEDDSTKSASEEVFSDFDSVYIDVNKLEIVEGGTEEMRKPAKGDSGRSRMESLNEISADAIIKKKSGLKKFLTAFRKSAIGEGNSESSKENMIGKIISAANEKENRQTSRTCTIL